LKVVSHVPRNAPSGKTQEGNDTSWAGAGKHGIEGLAILGRGQWGGSSSEPDPWGSKAGRWMGSIGGAMVRAGLLAWADAGGGQGDGRKIGIVGIGLAGGWPGWLREMKAGDVVGAWREKPPLWLLEWLPNLPAAQLAIEIGAKGSVETLRPRTGARSEAEWRARRWMTRGMERIILVEVIGDGAEAVVLAKEGKN